MNAARHFLHGLLTFFLLLVVHGVHGEETESVQKLIEAIRSNNPTVYQQVLAAGGDVNAHDEGGNTLVAIAAQAGSSVILKDLLGRGARDGELGSLGNSALGFACARGDVQMVTDLLDAGADLSTLNARDEPPLVDAIRSGDPRAVDLLLARGADPDQPSGELRMTPLMIAIKEDAQTAFTALMDRRAALELQDAQGATALYWAIHEDKKYFAERLLAAGANYSNVITGHSALAVAVGEKRDDIAQLVRDNCRCE